MVDNKVTVGILTTSDTRSLEDDQSGAILEAMVRQMESFIVAQRRCVRDNVHEIKHTLIEWCDSCGLNLILTTGGTGFSATDVTPEATLAVLDKLAPGLTHIMMAKSLEVTPMAALSRAVAGIRKTTIIINLPGSPKGAKECLSFVSAVLPHAVDLVTNQTQAVQKTHQRASHSGAGHSCHHTQQCSAVDASSIANRPRQSTYPMISVHDAQLAVLRNCQALSIESIAFHQAFGRTLAQNVFASDPLPPFPASTKDGYAVISQDGMGLRPVAGCSNAGSHPHGQLFPGQCVRINTGAPVPLGADAVVQVEDTKLTKASEDGKQELEIEIMNEPKPGQDIRQVGSDIEAESMVLLKHMRIGAAEIGLLAAVGALQVEVFRKPVVALLSTGDELQDPVCGEKLRPECIRDSNRPTLIALLQHEHSFPVVDCGIAKDNPQDLLEKLKQALSCADILVTTGGVSMGDRDYLRNVLLQDLQAELHFARVNMKPGKPTVMATLNWHGKKKLLFGLPGNPVSASVTAHLYVLPACRLLSGIKAPFPAKVRAKMPCSLPLDPRPEYVRCVLKWLPGQGVADIELTGNQISSRLASMREANGLAILPGRTDTLTHVGQGFEVDVLIIGPLLQSSG